MKKSLTLLSLFSLYSNAAVDYDKVANDTFRKIDNSVTIQIIPSSYRLNWTTPKNLIFSLIKNQYFFPKTKATLGHVTAEVNCTSSIDGKKSRVFLGQKVEDLNGFRDHVINGHGFSVLNRPRNNYSDVPLLTINGSLDNYSDSLKKFNRLISKNHFGSLTFKVNELGCMRALSFMKEYEKSTKESDGAGNRYGFGADPKKFEGAGCASFVETVLEYANVPNIDYWLNQTVFIPDYLLGNLSKKRPVSIFKLLMSSEKLLKKNISSKRFTFPDPQVIFDRLNEQVAKELIFKRTLNSKVIAVGIDVSE